MKSKIKKKKVFGPYALSLTCDEAHGHWLSIAFVDGGKCSEIRASYPCGGVCWAHDVSTWHYDETDLDMNRDVNPEDWFWHFSDNVQSVQISSKIGWAWVDPDYFPVKAEEACVMVK